ncbi:AarF/UbiB family protein [Nioella sp.]|uniref:AarF/UbiB family protein n=1 Tax=Nioella sp. TaxID=1912091 RepID=UPI003A8C827F
MNRTRNLQRLARIAVVLAKDVWTLRRYDPASGDTGAPDRFAQNLLALGPVFVKLGQILSTRPDILPESYVARLAELQERAPRVDFATVRRMVEDELATPLEAAFASFEAEPAAAASLAQVHKASLADGTAVAVKVQRPGLEPLFHRDLDALDLGLRIARIVLPRRLRRTNLPAFLSEFRRYSLAELDFRAEAAVMDRFRRNLAGQGRVRIPRTYPDQTTARMLTMDWVDGMRLSEAAATLPEQAQSALVEALVSMLLKMFVSDGLFHADLHPGNIVFHADGTVTLLDFGMYGELNAAQRDRFVLYWMAVAQRQTRRAYHHFSAQTEALQGADHALFRQRFEELAEKFYAAPSREASLARTYLAMMRAGYRAGFVFPASLMLHAKALTTAEALLFVLAPDARFDDLSRPFIAREVAARLASSDPLGRLAQVLPELLLTGALPPAEAIDEIWDDTATQKIGRGILEAVFPSGEGIGRAALTKLFSHVALRHLGKETDAILSDIWAGYEGLERDLPLEPNAGAILTTHLAALTLALHRTLVARGRSEAQSHEIIHAIGWDIYDRMADPPFEIARAITTDPTKRMRIATGLFRRFPFGPPAYGWRDVEAGGNVVAFDCTKCPVAAFFAVHEASALCTATWCALDFPVAEKWGGQLVRPKTIAGGHDHCDFRWHTLPMLDKDETGEEAEDAGQG